MKDRIGASSKKKRPVSAGVSKQSDFPDFQGGPSSPNGSGGSGKKLAIIIGIVVLVLLIIAAVFIIKGMGGGKKTPGPSTVTPEPAAPSEETTKRIQEQQQEHDLLMKTKALPVPSVKAVQDIVAIRKLVGDVQIADDGVNPNLTASLEDESLASKAAEFKASTNDDTVGWVKLPNTNVDYAVVHKAGVENYDYYNHLDYNKNYSKDGVIWADYECEFPDISQNTTLYGHNWYNVRPPIRTLANMQANDTMFSLVHAYVHTDFAQQNPFVYFSTTEKDYVWQVFAAFYTDMAFTYSWANMDQTTFQKTIAEAKAKSVQEYGVTVTSDDKILTLSTCTRMMNANSSDENQRFVVMAKLVREGTPSTKISSTVNPMKYTGTITNK